MFKAAVITSLKWAAIGRFSSQLITWAITIVVIRLLSPADYGTMAYATLVVSFFAVFEELGLSAAIVNTRNLSDEMIQKVFGIVVIVATIVYVVLYMLAPLAADFFGDQELTTVIRVLATSVPMSALGAIPLALIQREMRFKHKSIAEFVAAASSSVITLVLALAGYAVWALVAGSVALAVVRTGGYWVALGKLYFPRMNFGGVRSELQFGGMISIDRLLYIFYSQADTFFVGKFLGREVLGLYSVATQLATLPMRKIVGILNEVGFSAFSKIQEDKGEVAEKLLQAVRSLSIVSFPVFLGLSAVAPDITSIFLGEKWVAVATPLALLSVVVPLRLVNTTTATMLHGIGRADVAAKNSLTAFVFFTPAFGAAAVWGDLTAVCLVWVVGFPIYQLSCLWRALPHVRVPLSRYFGEMRRSALSAAVMFLAVHGVGTLLGGVALPELLVLILKMATGAGVYLALMWAFARGELLSLAQLLKS